MPELKNLILVNNIPAIQKNETVEQSHSDKIKEQFRP